ncbi:MAG: RNA polymerase sigma factor [Planctomycetes bacterium]|nr:RNA polymerase sigma factor [Planctomycetota bacterium]
MTTDVPTLDVRSDEQLAVAAQGGCRASFELIVLRMHGPLYGYLRRLAASREDAEDVVQETFVRAYRKLDRYDPDWRLSTWLFTIGRRLWINHRRQSQRARKTGEAAAEIARMAALSSSGRTVDPAVDPAAAMIVAEERQQLWQIAAAVLSEPQYTALWLFYVEGLPVAEIARVLRRSPASVKAVMFRARRRLLPHYQELIKPRPVVAGTAHQTTLEKVDATAH